MMVNKGAAVDVLYVSANKTLDGWAFFFATASGLWELREETGLR
jgi:hypothetical protein